MRKATLPTPLWCAQSGQSMIEMLMLTAVLGAIWWLPATAEGHTLWQLLSRIAESSIVHFQWIWNRFLLNPLVF